MVKPISKIPILLFPLKLETRFVKDELWVRVFPDEAFLQSHDPTLSPEQRIDSKAFQSLTSDHQRKEMWKVLVNRYGLYQASWIAHIDPEVRDQQSSDENDNEPSFYFKWLPDRFVYYIYKEGDVTPTYQEDGSVIDREGLTLLGDGDEWLQDFDRAIQLGMGVKIKINAEDTKFERVIVSGFRHDNDPTVPANGLADLLDNHKYSQGFSFLKHGTPTNNTEGVRSGHSVRDEYEAIHSYEYAVKGLELDSGDVDGEDSDLPRETAGRYLARSLGISTDHLKHVQHSDQRPSLLNEAFQKASWFALGAQPLFMLLGNQLSAANHESIWEHYSRYVKGKGKFSAVKIGHQPYGILPVMNISHVFRPEHSSIFESDHLFDKMMVFFARLMKRWLLMVKSNGSEVPRLTGKDDQEEVLKILSMQDGSQTYHIRALEYGAFRSQLYDFVEKSDGSISTLNDLNNMGGDISIVQENISSLSELFNLDGGKLDDQLDLLLRAPLLSFRDANRDTMVLGQGHSLAADDQAQPQSEDEGHPETISLGEKDLAHFKEFIQAIQTQSPNNMIQYRGDLSLFTDLFVRSYINAVQLYCREIVFDPEVSKLSGGAKYKIVKVPKTDLAEVTKGEVVITIEDENSKPILISAPFGGIIRGLAVKEMDIVGPGSLLFTLCNEPKFDKIKSQYVRLGQYLINAIEAIEDPKDRIVAQKKAIGEVVDLNSYRLDAWITSLAARRMDDLRKKSEHPEGIYFGAYGWVEELEKDATEVNPETLTDEYREAGGIIHTPGVAQTVAASVFKNSFLAHQNDGESNLFALNLTSDRLQKSMFFLDGIRQGQQLEALLGYQLERHLHEHNLHQDLYTLRKAFPLYENTMEDAKGFEQLSVIDGLKAINNKENLPNNLTSVQTIRKQIDKLEDTLDGSLDALFYEAGYQVTQGNLDQAAAVIEATKGSIEPPQIESLKTKIPGTGINHKLVMIFPPHTERYSLENARAFAEPNLENWLQKTLGPLDEIVCPVELYDTQEDSLIASTTINLGEVGISYLDLLYMSDDEVSDGGSELESRIRNTVWAQEPNLPKSTKYIITTADPESGASISQVLEVTRRTKTLLSKCRYLESDDVALEGESPLEDVNRLHAIKDNQILPIVDRLKILMDSDLKVKSNLKWLSNLDFDSAKTAYLDDTMVDTARLKSTIEKRIFNIEDLLKRYDAQNSFDQSFDLLRQIAKSLFGETFILLPPVVVSGNFDLVLDEQNQSLVIGDPEENQSDQVWGQERVENWLQGVAQVHENTEIFEDWLMVQHVWNQTMGLSTNYQFAVVQGPTLNQYPWVALSKNEIDLLLKSQYESQSVYTDPVLGESFPLSDGSYYPEGCESIVLYAPENLNTEELVYGLAIEEFSEHIPDTKMNTGLSFNYNAPDNEPPQAVLVAIHPKAMEESEFFWSEDDLRDILYDTMDLYKIRMVDLEALQEYGFVLPMTYWFHLPGHK